ncbi:hypothetical protein ABVT39_018674 [Epinephelus coioides]
MTPMYVQFHMVRHESVYCLSKVSIWTVSVLSFIMAGRLLFVILMYSCREIQVEARLPPTLIVNPVVITETDSVTLNCWAPSSVSVSQCHIYIVGQESPTILSCMKTLTGSELLIKAHQSSPAEVKVKCFYTVKQGQVNSPSPHSDASSITIHSQKPQMSAHFDGEFILFTCTLPGSANNDARCNLYFGEEGRPVVEATVWHKKMSNSQSFCQFTVSFDDLSRRLHFLQRRDASCDYSSGSEPNSLSPRSDRYSLTGLTDSKLHSSTPVTPTKKTPGVTAGRSSYTGSFISASLTPVRPTSGQTPPKPGTNANSFPVTPPNSTSAETWTWKLVVAAACFGGVVFLGLALLCAKRRTAFISSSSVLWCVLPSVADDLMCMKNLDHGGSLPAGNDEAYSVITSVPAADCPAGSQKRNGQESQNEDLDVYHVYATVSEEPHPSALKDMVYSTLQAH